MSAAFNSIKAGLTEALAHAKGEPSAVREHRVRGVDVRELRAQIGLTQEQFSAKFGISLPTLRHWERGDRKPQGAALVLLNVIAKEPKAVLRALA
jgi:putative transcriptional regulator